MGKGEIAYYEQFHLFPVFSKDFYCRHVKTRDCMGKVKPNLLCLALMLLILLRGPACHRGIVLEVSIKSDRVLLCGSEFYYFFYLFI